MSVVLVGCQCQQSEKKQVSYYTARAFADERGIHVLEVCGQEGVNVEIAFMTPRSAEPMTIAVVHESKYGYGHSYADKNA